MFTPDMFSDHHGPKVLAAQQAEKLFQQFIKLAKQRESAGKQRFVVVMNGDLETVEKEEIVKVFRKNNWKNTSFRFLGEHPRNFYELTICFPGCENDIYASTRTIILKHLMEF